MNPIKIHLPIIPPRTTHQRKRLIMINGHASMADSPELQRTISDYLVLLAPFKPETPLTGPIRFSATFCFPHKRNTPIKDRDKTLPKLTRPDWDNMAKTLQDCLTRLSFWLDDCQVFSAEVKKVHGATPFVEVEIIEE